MPVLSDSYIETRRPIRFTPQDYYALADQGLLRTPTELVDGQIIEMPAQHYPAVAAIGEIYSVLRGAWHDKRCVVTDMTVPFPSGWNPRPDVAVFDVLPPRRPLDAGRFPTPRLVVEVSDTTLDYDLGEKADRYAAEGVAELWVGEVSDGDPAGRRLHVLRDPGPSGYRDRAALGPGDAVSPLCLTALDLAVIDLLPAYPERA